MPIKYNENLGYFEWIQKDEYYNKIVSFSNATINNQYSGNCVLFNESSYNLNSCDSCGNKLCMYDRSYFTKTENFCLAYEKICNHDEKDLKCFCQSPILNDYFCQVDLCR